MVVGGDLAHLELRLLGGVVATVVRSCAKIGSANVNLVIVS